MHRTTIESALVAPTQSTVRLCGWVKKVRNTKYMVFVILRDHTANIQITINKENGELTNTALSMTAESVVEITGIVERNEKVALHGFEVVPHSITVINPATSPLPINSKSQLSQRLDWRFLDLRSRRNRLIFEIQTTAEQAMRCWWLNHGFLEMHSPKLMGHASESGAELFKLNYFDGTAYLAQSPQFYKQMAMAAGYDRVFEIGPVFRANPSFTTRHDTEFTSVDVEVSWVDSHEDVMSIEEQWIAYVLNTIRLRHGHDIKDEFGMDVIVPSTPFPRVTMAEAHEIMHSMGHEPPQETKGDLDPEGERLLCRAIKQRHGHEFVFVTDWPWELRPFYHMCHAGDSKLTKSFDLLWRGLEITTGAQREHRPDVLEAQAVEKGIDPKEIDFYLNFFRYGMPPHGGFGFGLSRMLMLLTGMSNVREVTYLHRAPNRLTP